MITVSTPPDWRELQNEVARVLRECGFGVEVEHTVATVRGQVELDVFAEETVRGRKYSIACECKHWRANVPQSVIHGFRTVVADIGANVGYVITTNGFQTGAFSAADLTNLRLVTWPEFQQAFEETWFEQYLSPKVVEELDDLLSFTEPLLPRWFEQLSEDGKTSYLALKQKYDDFGWLVMAFTPYARMLRKKEGPTPLPVIDRLPADSPLLASVPRAILEAVGYRDFLELVVPFGKEAIRQFSALDPRRG